MNQLIRAVTHVMQHTRLIALTLVLAVLSTGNVLAQEAEGDQEYKRVYNSAREAAENNNVTEAYELFTQAATLAAEAGDQDVVNSSNRVLAQIDRILGVQALKQENYEQALEHANTGIEHNADYAPNYYNKGLALKNMDRIDEALDTFVETVEVATANNDSRTANTAQNAIRDQIVYMASARLSQDGDNISRTAAQEALEILARLENYNLEPDADTYYYMAVANDAMGNYDEAVAYADQALEAFRGSLTEKARIYLLKGEALLNAGDQSGARTALQEALYGEYRQRAEYLLEEIGTD